jgi:hypothetical protein
VPRTWPARARTHARTHLLHGGQELRVQLGELLLGLGRQAQVRNVVLLLLVLVLLLDGRSGGGLLGGRGLLALGRRRRLLALGRGRGGLLALGRGHERDLRHLAVVLLVVVVLALARRGRRDHLESVVQQVVDLLRAQVCGRRGRERTTQ